MNLARRERVACSDALLSAGAYAGTLCGDWTCHDLAAHLYLREHRPDAGPGLLLAPLAGWTARVQASARQRPFAELVAAVRSGPPRASLFALPGVDAAINTVEYLVHHEDVRRAGPRWTPRQLAAEDQARVWRLLGLYGRRGLAAAPVPVILDPSAPRRDPIHAGRRRGRPVRVQGEPVELLLFALGRQQRAQVRLDGDEADLAALCAAQLGY